MALNHSNSSNLGQLAFKGLTVPGIISRFKLGVYFLSERGLNCTECFMFTYP